MREISRERMAQSTENVSNSFSIILFLKKKIHLKRLYESVLHGNSHNFALFVILSMEFILRIVYLSKLIIKTNSFSQFVVLLTLNSHSAGHPNVIHSIR